MKIRRAARTVRSSWLAPVAVVLLASCENSPAREAQVELSGRVFAAETGKALEKVSVKALGGASATSARDGTFKLRYGSKRDSALHASAAGAAPLRKPAPKAGGYIEIFVKGFDAQEDVDPVKGGGTFTSDGAQLKVAGDTLKPKGRSGAPGKLRLSIATPRPKRPTDLASIPGNFDARQRDKRGKLSAESPLYAGAYDDDQELELKSGEKASIDLPVLAKVQKGTGAKHPLYHYDEAEELWVEAGTVEETTNEAGLPVYRGEIGTLGWWAVGEFYDQLSCVHGCVEDASESPAAGARIVVSGIDHDSQITTYAGSDGCYALDVRAGARISVVAQTAGSFAGPVLVTASAESGSAQDGLDACLALEVLRLARSDTTRCPLGLTECGAVCVDTNLDPEHCGGCNNGCDDSPCAAGMCGADSEPDGGVRDADAGTDAGSADAETSALDGAPEARLIVATRGAGQGTVSSTPGGIECGDTCDALFPTGTEVTLVAMEDTATSTFGGWSGDCAASAEPTCILTVDVVHSATANFALRSLPISVTVGGTGTGTVLGELAGTSVVSCAAVGGDCSESVLHGSVVTFTAQPGTYSAFSGWGGACAGQGMLCTVPITQAASVSASFSLLQYTLTVRVIATVNPPGDGTVTSSPPGISCTNNAAPSVTCSSVYAAGSVIQLTATPDDPFYYGFNGWGGACSGTNTTCTITLGTDLDVSADFYGIIF